MIKRILTLFMLVIFLAACSNPISQDMFGRVIAIEDGKVHVDISNWKKGDNDNGTDEGYEYTANLTDETSITYENGDQASIEDIKIDQKIEIKPSDNHNSEGTPDEIVLLEMTDEEKYRKILSPRDDKLKVVFLHDSGPQVTPDLDGSKLRSMNVFIEHVLYRSNYVVDFKEEFNIEEFPTIIVSDHQEVLLQTNSEEELFELLEKEN